jgi:hypothetical protein
MTMLVKKPGNLNRLPGFAFGAGIDPNNNNDLACNPGRLFRPDEDVSVVAG